MPDLSHLVTVRQERDPKTLNRPALEALYVYLDLYHPLILEEWHLEVETTGEAKKARKTKRITRQRKALEEDLSEAFTGHTGAIGKGGVGLNRVKPREEILEREEPDPSPFRMLDIMREFKIKDPELYAQLRKEARREAYMIKEGVIPRR